MKIKKIKSLKFESKWIHICGLKWCITKNESDPCIEWIIEPSELMMFFKLHYVCQIVASWQSPIGNMLKEYQCAGGFL
jgi:hypothetical protein